MDLLKKKLENQDLLLKRVLAGPAATSATSSRGRSSKGDDKKKDKLSGSAPITAGIKSRGKVFIKEVKADGENWHNYNQAWKKAMVDFVEDKEKASLEVIAANEDAYNARMNADFDEWYEDSPLN